MERVPVVVPLLLASMLAGPALRAQEQPLAVGSDGVPAPKKSKDVRPKYPPDAVAQGIRGIVILDLVIGKAGTVEDVVVVRSIPGLDEAAIAAARQWRYSPVKVDGQPVRVRMTVPITFTLALPTLAREGGIPELRQGAVPVFPASGEAGSATVSVTLDAEGRVSAASVVAGDEPWTRALVTAIKTWRFTAPPDDAVLSFRVQASFTRATGSEPDTVALSASGLESADLLGAAHAKTALATPAAPASAAAPVADDAAPRGTPAAEEPPPQAPPPGAPAVPGSQPDVIPPPDTAGTPPAAPPAGPPATAPATPSSSPATPSALPPPQSRPVEPGVEVITAPLPVPDPENGISAVRDIVLEPGVPELSRGRRPVPPPLARMNRTTGTVEVLFSVSAAGAATIQKVNGPDLLKKAAEQAVASWVFRRTRADRAYLVAVFTYAEDKASAVVRPQPAPATAPPSAGAPQPATEPPTTPTAPPSTAPPSPPAATEHGLAE